MSVPRPLPIWRRVLLVLECFVCFVGPLGALLFLSILVPHQIRLLPYDTGGGPSVVLLWVALAYFGLYGVWATVRSLVSDEAVIRHPRFVKGCLITAALCVAVGPGAGYIVGRYLPNEPFDLALNLVLPLACLAHLAFLARRQLVKDSEPPFASQR